MSTCVTLREFTELHDRYTKWEAAGFPKDDGGCPVDPLLPELLHKLNNLPGITTVYACEGHPAYQTHYTGARRNRPTPFYVMCAVTMPGMEMIMEIYSTLQHRFSTLYAQRLAAGVTGLRLEFGTTFWPDGQNRKKIIPYVKIEARADSASRKETLFKELHAVLDQAARWGLKR